jgi:hypothetical protein
MLNILRHPTFALPMTQEKFACEMQASRKRPRIRKERSATSHSLRVNYFSRISNLDLLRYP